MTFLSALYTLIISPLELLFEVVFTIANRIIGNAGLSIIVLSLTINFLVLPLYKRADELQAEERDVQAKMSPWIKHIKKTFKGDERFFMLQEYYRINHYKPIYALKSSLSILLQIPFFIAAYNLLSGMQGLRGMQFGFISDLGKEDAMFALGSFPINVLPILMTLINIVSGIIYTKGHPLKAKIQVYGLAVVFLVLLYHSPSGLVFYWLLNNVFSLVKNVFYKLKEPRKALNVVLSVAGLFIIVSTLVRSDLDARQKILLSLGGILLSLPLASSLFKSQKERKQTADGKDDFSFFTGAIMMAMLTGFLIPANVVSSSSLEFINVLNPTNPILYIVNSMLLAFGSWVLWGSVFYFLMSDRIKSIFCTALLSICGISIFTYMLFGKNLGILSSTLKYEKTPSFILSEYLLNTAGIIVITVILSLVYKRFHVIVRTIVIVAILTITLFGALDVSIIRKTYNWFESTGAYSSEMPEIPLSKNGKNVIVIMLDRAVGTLVPYIFNEKPELKDKFDGFTYYPNTISYGNCTVLGSPAIFGGYEYTPERMNERSDVSLVNKHNEALKVLPALFGGDGYEITIFDPPYAGYTEIPNLSIYKDYPDFHCYNTNGKFSIFEDEEDNASSIDAYAQVNEIRKRSLFCFALMKTSPLVLQETIYNGGNYNKADKISDDGASGLSASSLIHTLFSLSTSYGYEKVFIDSYPVLKKLPELTKISEGSSNTFFMMANDTTHSPCLLQEPDYVPALKVDNTKYDVDMVNRYTVNGITMRMESAFQVTHYHVNMAALLQLANWFDYMRENGVYDNTRIILVADHGCGLNQFDLKCGGEDMEYYLPLYMVKDFNSKGFKSSDEFMTVGDTPAMATSGLFNDPKNPFTGNPLNASLKKGPQTLYYKKGYNPTSQEAKTFVPDSKFILNGNPHDPGSWKSVSTN